jgi:hypothetical protein
LKEVSPILYIIADATKVNLIESLIELESRDNFKVLKAFFSSL